MAGEETIGRATVQLGADGSKLGPEMAAALAKAQGTLERANKKMERAQASTMKAVQGHIDKINATRPTHAMRLLEQAVAKLGGTSALNAGQLKRLRGEIEGLAGAGAKIPKAFEGLDKTQGKIAGVVQALGTGKGLSGALGAIGPAGIAAAGGIGALGLAAKAALSTFNELSQRGTAVLGVTQSFQALAGDYKSLLDASRSATGGMISDFDLMQNANKGLLLGLPITAKEMETLGKTAVTLGRAMNVGPTQALQDLITGLGRGSAAILDNLGITIKAEEAQKNYAASIGKQASALTDAEKKLAIYKAALTAAEDSVTKIGVAQDSAGDATQRLAAQWQNLKDAMAVAITETDGSISSMDALAESIGLVGEAMKSSFGKATIQSAINGLTLVATSGLSEFGRVRRGFKTYFGDLGGAPTTGDTRRGSIFGPQGFMVPLPRDSELEAERQSNERKDKALDKQIAKQKEIADLLEKQYASARKLAFEIMKAAQAKYPGMTRTLGIETLPGARNLGFGAMVGAKNYDFGIDAQGFITFGNAAEVAAKQAAEGAEQLAKAAEKTETFFSGLSNGLALLGGALGAAWDNVLGVINNVSQSFKGGKMSGTDKFNAIAGSAGQLGSLIPGTGGKMLAGAAGGAMTGVALGSVVPVVGNVVGGIVGGLVGAIGGYFAGRKAKKEAEEVAALIGTNFSTAQLAALKATAKSLGKNWKTYLQEEMQKAQDLEIAKEKRRKLEQGLGSAKTSAESLMARISEGGLSEGLAAALQAIVGKVGEALLKNGLGILDARLSGSAEFAGVQGAAGDVAGAMAGMRQAGMLDAGLMAAGGAAAAELQGAAVEAAKAAGLGPEEATKAGFAAIAPLLREQLNASIQSGKALDENTKRLLAEAELNGIQILADPALEQLDVAKEQLNVLKQIANGRGVREDGAIPAAKGLGPAKMPNVGGGLGPRIQTHAGEFAFVLPASKSRGVPVVYAARGIYDDDIDPRPRRGTPSDASDPGGYESPAEAAASAMVEVAAAVADLKAAVLKRPEPTIVNNTNQVQIVDQSAVKTAEGQRAFGRFVVAEVERALDQNSRGLTSKFETIARRAVR